MRHHSINSSPSSELRPVTPTGLLCFLNCFSSVLYLSLAVWLCLSICLSVSVSLSVCRPIYVSLSVFLHLCLKSVSFGLHLCLLVFQFICLSLCLLVFDCLCVCFVSACILFSTVRSGAPLMILTRRGAI